MQQNMNEATFSKPFPAIFMKAPVCPTFRYSRSIKNRNSTKTLFPLFDIFVLSKRIKIALHDYKVLDDKNAEAI